MAIYKEVSRRIENPEKNSFGVQFNISPIDRLVPYDLYGILPGQEQPTFFTVSAPFSSNSLAIQQMRSTDQGEYSIATLFIGPHINSAKISGVDISGDVRKDDPNPPITLFRWGRDE